MRRIFHAVQETISWVILAALLCLMCYTVFHVYTTKKNGDSTFLFGYRPVLALTNSMEPYLMTDGLALTKKVSALSEISVGDVVTYRVQSNTGRTISITHRIVSISKGGVITARGDNNSVSDPYPLKIRNIEAKVVYVFNQTAWIAAKWRTISGRIMLFLIPSSLVLLWFSLKRQASVYFKGPVEHHIFPTDSN